MRTISTTGRRTLMLLLGLLVALPILPAHAYTGDQIVEDTPEAWTVALADIESFELAHANHVAGSASEGGQVCDIKLLANYGYQEVTAEGGVGEARAYAHDLASADIPCFSFNNFETYTIHAWTWFEYWDRELGRYEKIQDTTRPCSGNSIAGLGAQPCTNQQLYNRDDIDYVDGDPAKWINAIHRACFDLTSPQDAAEDLPVSCSEPWNSIDAKTMQMCSSCAIRDLLSDDPTRGL